VLIFVVRTFIVGSAISSSKGRFTPNAKRRQSEDAAFSRAKARLDWKRMLRSRPMC